MTKKKSAKQLFSERETALEKRNTEIEAEYASMVTNWKKDGLEQYFSIPEKEDWVRRELEKWVRQQRLIISGKYQDRKKIVSEYHQKFVEFIRQLCPKIIEELKTFVPLFDKLFGENKDNYVALFNWYKVNLNLVRLNQSLDTVINSFIPHYSILQFRPFENWSFRYDYKWGENRVLLYFLYWVFEPADSQKEAEIRQDLLKLLQKNLIWQRSNPNFPTQFDEANLQQFTEKESARIFEEFIKNREDSYFTSEAKQRLSGILKDIQTDAEPNIEAFILLQIELLKWAESHNLEKDWLLRYGYDFLKQFSNNPNLKGSEVEVGCLQVRSLEAFPFTFKFDGWVAGDEEKEKYEKRLRESFESAVEGYFQQVGDYFELEKIKKVSRPKDYDRVKWLVRWTVQDWSKEQIQEEIELEFQNKGIEKYIDISTIDKAFRQFKKFDLPVKA